MALEPTADPGVFIEARGDGWVRYRRDDGRRWEVHGVCDRRGDCLIGAVVTNEHGEPEQIRDHDHLAEMTHRLGRDRVDGELDVPVTPEFSDCCPFTYVELEPVR